MNNISRKSTATSSTRIGSSHHKGHAQIKKESENLAHSLLLKHEKQRHPKKLKPLDLTKNNVVTTTMVDGEDVFSKVSMAELDSDLNEYLNYNNIMNQMSSAFNGGVTDSSHDEIKSIKNGQIDKEKQEVALY